MTIVEKILAAHAKVDAVRPGDIVDADLDTVVLLDINFLPGHWPDILKVDHPEKIIIVFDHLAPAKDIASATAHSTARAFAKQFGIDRIHDIGARQGIVHQVVGDEAYALPGDILVCADSHTCSAGAFNAAARGIGSGDVMQAACTGRTWFECGPTVKYRLEGRPGDAVTPKDVFLEIANRYGEHTMQNLEFEGSTVDGWEVDERRALATMCAELGAEFPVFPFDDRLAAHFSARGRVGTEAVVADPDATYLDTRTVDVAGIAPMVALPGSVVHNCQPVTEIQRERVAVQQCFVGSCANGTLQDIEIAARIVKGRQVRDGVRFIVTPGSQEIYRQAVLAGHVAVLQEAGAVVTSSACGACAGLDMGALAAGETAITSSTRNYTGRMGSPQSSILIGSSATVAATAIAGYITDPREVS